MIARRLRHVLSSMATLVAVAAIAGAPPVVLAAQGLTLTTDYPAVTVRPDSQVSLDLAVDTSAPARINLSLSGTPSGWTAELHGGGFVIGAVQTNGSDPTAVRLDIDVPADASGTERIVVAAFDATSRVELPIDITVTAQAGGEVSISTDFNALRGAAGASFTFNLNISNETEEDLTYSSTGQGPALWTVDAKPSGQSQAVSGTVLASGTAGVTVTVDAPDGATAGTYDLTVVTTVGTEQIETPLQVEITGSYGLTVSTESGALSGRGPAGGVTTQTFTIENTGTAPVTGVEVTATKPAEWEVTLDPATIPSIAPGEVVNVTAQITPSGNAISGDYELTITARGEEANDAAEIRFTVEASILGAVIGAALIIAAFGGLWWVFRRYGRR